MRKAPQERATPIMLHERFEDGVLPLVRLTATDDRISIGRRALGDSKYRNVTLESRESIEFLRDYCDAWLEHHDAQEEP